MSHEPTFTDGLSYLVAGWLKKRTGLQKIRALPLEEKRGILQRAKQLIDVEKMLSFAEINMQASEEQAILRPSELRRLSTLADLMGERSLIVFSTLIAANREEAFELTDWIFAHAEAETVEAKISLSGEHAQRTEGL